MSLEKAFLVEGIVNSKAPRCYRGVCVVGTEGTSVSLDPLGGGSMARRKSRVEMDRLCQYQK